MTAIQLKAEIDKELDKLSEETLAEILDYIKKQSSTNTRFDENLKRILKEDDGLLTRLAQ